MDDLLRFYLGFLINRSNINYLSKKIIEILDFLKNQVGKSAPLFLALFLVVLSIPVQAEIKVHNPSARIVPGGKVGAVFFTLENNGASKRILVKASSDAADFVELHYQFNDDGVMKMRKLSKIVIPANDIVHLESGGIHAMLLGLKKQFHVNDKVKITLEFFNKEKINLSAIIEDNYTNHSMHNH